MLSNNRLFNQSELRLALTAGLSAGLIITLGLPDAMYAPMAVAAVLSGTLGNSLSLGIQRIQGTILGGVILFIAHNTIATSMPMPIGIGISLACTR
ncbi:MAG: FUSC family protein, partial [Synechococcaceae bacterium WBB_32_011]|nr:FUSC family protein [Synechococcaceae bacterium WBB_32_011]